MGGHVYMLDDHTFNVDSHELLVGFHVCTWTSTHIFGYPQALVAVHIYVLDVHILEWASMLAR